jgi:oxygen-dependent protoporphyrinogen oxidase
MKDVVIVGAGIAGLAAAFELQRRGLRPLVLERAARPGGVITTDRVGGYVIDGGPDSLLTQKLAATDLIRELGLESRFISTLLPRTAYVLKRGRLLPLPEASFLGLPTRWRPFVTTRLFSWPSKVRMAAEVVTASKSRVDDESIGAFMRRHFGEQAVRYLAEPLLAGIHAGDVERLSVQALFPRLAELEASHTSILRALLAAPRPHAPDGAFVSFPGGMGELVDALVARLGDAIECDSTVARIDGLKSPFTVTLASRTTIQTRAVILAVPAWSAATIVRPVEPAIARWCDEIPYASSATVALAFERAHVRSALEGTGFVVPRSERRAILAGTWVTSKWPDRAPPGKVLLRAFLGGTRDPAVVQGSDFELTEAALGDLSPLLGITGSPTFTRVYRWMNATPQYNVGHLARVRQIDERLATIRGLYLTGSGYRGTGIPDCIADAVRTAQAAAADLAAAGQEQGSAIGDQESGSRIGSASE